MRSKTKERQFAEQLRLNGLSYGEIIQQIPVTKSTLSVWLSKIKLQPAQHQRIKLLFKTGQRAGADTRREERINKTSLLRNEASNDFSSLSLDPFFNFGLSLYWAEGTKQKPWNISARVQFSNSDPLAIMAMRKWFKKYTQNKDSDFIYGLYIHETASVDLSRQVWADKLHILPEDLSVVLKRNNSIFRHNNKAQYFGLVRLTVKKSTWLNRRISIWTELATQKFLNDEYQ